MEETQIKINLDHHFNLALPTVVFVVRPSLIQPYIHVKAKDIKYIWKLFNNALSICGGC